MKAVLDSSVLVSAFITPHGAVGRFLKSAREGAFTLCLSAEILEETRDKLLNAERLRERYSIADEAAEAFCSGLARVAWLPEALPAIEPVCRDPDDDHVLAAALAAGADCIVTGDLDLLDLGTWQGIAILTVREAADRLGGVSA